MLEKVELETSPQETRVVSMGRELQVGKMDLPFFMILVDTSQT